MLGVWFRYEHGCSLALHVLGLGFLLLRVRSRELEQGEAPLLISGALGRQVEQLQRRVQLLVDSEPSFILTSRTPSENAEMMASSVTLGILRRTLLKRWMYF